MILIAAIFLTLFLIEGLGIPLVRQYIPYLYFLLPAGLYTYSVIVQKHIVVPARMTICYFAFLALSGISSIFFSVDKGTSVIYLLFYLSSYFIFLFFYNHQSFSKTLIVWIALIGSILFIPLSLLGRNDSFVRHGYQFTVSYFSSHNHLGDFLGIVLIIAAYWFIETKAKRYILLFLAAFPFFLISFSRTAYIALLIVAGIYGIYSSGRKTMNLFKIGLILSALIVFLFFLVSVKEAQKSPVFGPIHGYLVKTLALQPKEFLGGREEYISQILHSFYEKPFFGFGPGNFASASKRYQSNPFNWTETAHNIFLETLVENGLFAFLALGFFIYLLMRSVFKKHSLFSLMFIYLLLSFQTDYTYRIYSYFVFFMIVIATFYEEDKTIHVPSIFTLLSFIPLTYIVLVLGSTIFLMKHQYIASFLTNPFNKNIYPKWIEEEQREGNYKSVINLTNVYQWIASNDLTQLTFSAHLYETYQEKDKALSIYRKIYTIDPYASFRIPANIYRLMRENESEKNARQFITEALEKYRKYKYIEEYNKEVLKFCSEHKEAECKKLGWK